MKSFYISIVIYRKQKNISRMDLLNQLKTLRDNTTNPEVKSVCESHIRKIQNGEVLNESAVMESVGQTMKETEPMNITIKGKRLQISGYLSLFVYCDQ